MNYANAPKQGEVLTLEQLAAYPSETVCPQIAARFLGASPYGLNVAAKAGTLGLPHFFSGNRLRISKRAVLEFCGWRPEPDPRPEGSPAWLK